jgi:hypothetical protein
MKIIDGNYSECFTVYESGKFNDEVSTLCGRRTLPCAASKHSEVMRNIKSSTPTCTPTLLHASRNLIAWYLARAGEPIRLFFDPVEMSARITAMGFRYVENLSSNEINARYCLEGRSRLQLRGLRIISARI